MLSCSFFPPRGRCYPFPGCQCTDEESHCRRGLPCLKEICLWNEDTCVLGAWGRVATRKERKNTWGVYTRFPDSGSSDKPFTPAGNHHPPKEHSLRGPSPARLAGCCPSPSGCVPGTIPRSVTPTCHSPASPLLPKSILHSTQGNLH